MSSQLDILALEPFYGGVRRVMLETLVHYSRHRWTVLKLPPRRIERRLSAAAHWFGEQLARHWVGKVDLLFTSEALNLADLYRLMPPLLNKPSVVYFHSNQLPPVDGGSNGALDLVNLNSAAAATEIWFNSVFHVKSFLAKAASLVSRVPELATRNPMQELTRKAVVVAPPLGSTVLEELLAGEESLREERTIFVETRDADVGLINSTLLTLQRRGEQFDLVTVGPVEELDPSLERETLGEIDERAHLKAMLRSGIFLSTRGEATADHHAVRAMRAGCWPLFPQQGVYRELLPPELHSSCLYDATPEGLLGRLLDSFYLERPGGYESALKTLLDRYDPKTACKIFDEKLERLAGKSPA